MKSLQGHLLVASPDLLDPNFLESVVLLVQHNEEGALGLVLNRPTKTTVKQALEQVSDTSCECNDLLHLGGPCRGSLMALHPYDFLKEIEVLPNVFFSAESDNLERLVALNDAHIRFFVGFAGWTSGQLEAELESGSWRTVAANEEQIFSRHEDIWKNVTKQITGSALISTLKIRHVPDDPSMN